jgi:hypothetical protein
VATCVTESAVGSALGTDGRSRARRRHGWTLATVAAPRRRQGRPSCGIISRRMPRLTARSAARSSCRGRPGPPRYAAQPGQPSRSAPHEPRSHIPLGTPSVLHVRVQIPETAVVQPDPARHAGWSHTGNRVVPSSPWQATVSARTSRCAMKAGGYELFVSEHLRRRPSP